MNMSNPENSPYYCKHCKKVIRIAYRLHMWEKHGEGRKPFKSTFGKIELKNGSTIYVTTDGNDYKYVEGKSMKYIKLDEFID